MGAIPSITWEDVRNTSTTDWTDESSGMHGTPPNFSFSDTEYSCHVLGTNSNGELH